INRNKVDVIHAQTRTTQVLAWLLSKAAKARFVSTCHGFFKSDRIGRRIFGGWGDYVIAISEAVKDHLVNDFNVKEEKVCLLYNGVDTDKFSDTIPEDEKILLRENLGFGSRPVIGCIARLSPVKGLHYLLFAMKEVLKDLPEAQLFLVGDGPSRKELTDLAKRLGIDNNIFFASSNVQTGRLLSVMDVFVFHSLEEGLGLSLLEALASGKPCVASLVGGVSSIIEDGLTGVLVPPRDAHSLSEAITKVLKDKKLSALLAENGREIIKRKFSLDRMVEGVIDVYRKAIQK
ncbi:MAG: hypothetical protein A2Z72_00840, partial [Omnitrophica bacterium RBG_13_46_9]